MIIIYGLAKCHHGGLNSQYNMTWLFVFNSYRRTLLPFRNKNNDCEEKDKLACQCLYLQILRKFLQSFWGNACFYPLVKFNTERALLASWDWTEIEGERIKILNIFCLQFTQKFIKCFQSSNVCKISLKSSSNDFKIPMFVRFHLEVRQMISMF